MTAIDSASTTPSPPSFRDLWLGGVALFVVVVTLLLAYLAPLGFAPLISLAGLLALPGVRLTRTTAPPLLILLALAIWAAASMSWSPDAVAFSALKKYGDFEKLTAAKLFLQLLTYGAAVVALRRLSPPASHRAATVLAWGLVALSAVVLIDALGGAGIYQYLRVLTGDPIRPDLAMVKVSTATYAMTLLIWPVSLILSRRHVAPMVTLFLIAALVVSAKIVSSDACLLALIVGLFAWGLVRLAGKTGARILIALVAIPFILAPLAVLVGVETGLVNKLHQLVPPSWDARLNIWTFAADHVQTHPFRGWGLDASRTFGDAIPLHTHNAQLQLWLELGAIGAALAGIFFCWMAYGVLRLVDRSRGEAAAAAGSLVSYLVIGALSFGVWQEWWIALGAITLIALGLIPAGAPEVTSQLDELSSFG
ncbi:MAG: O-antigen ligase family protein [Caulobacter sp.]|nr:O-antigen ligase family protein [Caulobacter sp.]